MKARTSRKWLTTLEEQSQLASLAVAGDRAATEKLLASYNHLFDRLSSGELSKENREDFRSELLVFFMETLLPRLPRIGFRGYPGYIKVCLTRARNAMWARSGRNGGLITLDLTDVLSVDFPDIDPAMTKDIVWEILDSNPSSIRKSRLCCMSHLGRYAGKLKLSAEELRVKVAQTMVCAGFTLLEMEQIWGQCALFWMLKPAELKRLYDLSTERQARALDLYLKGFTMSGIGSQVSDGPGLLERLLLVWRKGDRDLSVLEYFRRLDRDRLLEAIKLAAPIQLRILQECLRGNDLGEIASTLGYTSRTQPFASLKALRHKLEK